MGFKFIILYIYSPMDDSSDFPSENQFYEHLTELIRVFKAVFLAFDDILALMRADDDYDQSIIRMRRILKDEAELIQQFNLSLEPHPHLHSAYQRFLCRLQQHITASKVKGAKEDRHIPIAQEYVIRIENCIHFHKRERNVARLFGRIIAYTLKFCQGCEMLLSCCSQNEAIQLLRKQAEQERQIIEQVKLQPRPSLPQNQFQSAFHKIMTIYNRRFSTINCLDLDYNTYKNYCFMSRNETDQELYKDFIYRNAIVQRAVIRYCKYFSDYLLRKEKNLMRKNRFRELKQAKVSERQESQHQTLYSRQNPEQKKSHPYLEPKTEESPIIYLPALQQSKKRILEAQRIPRQESIKTTRRNYHLKNIQITIGKQNEKCQTMHSQNRFMFNYSLPKPDQQKKYSVLRVNQTSLKKTQIINNESIPSSFLWHYDKSDGYQSYMLQQMLYQSKMAGNPRTSIIHKCHKEKKVDKRNIRITNLTFRGPNHTRLAPVLQSQNNTIS